ncbi:MAG: protein kinase, partial [Fibrobacter sp.]|nr:protein kinase [Fibrobacter sp.]
SLHTVGSKVMGTFAYLSPEQLNGEKLDQRSDVYALGAVLYEMISGSKTFPQKLLAELVQKKTRGQFVPLDSTGVQIPRALCNAVDKSLSLDKSKRFTDAGEFDQELMNILQKTTNKPPEDIVCAFMKSPHIVSASESSEKQNDRIIPAVIIGILFIILSTFFYFHRQKVKLPEVAKHEKENVKPVELPVSQDSKKTATISEVQKKSPPPEPKKQTVEQVETDQYSKALKAFESKNYSLSIRLFESIANEQLTQQQRSVKDGALLKSYIKTGDLEKAATFAERVKERDPQILIELSEGHIQQKQFDKALTQLQTAFQNATSRNIKKRSLELQTQIYDARYLSKPNRENKMASLRAWSLLNEEFCSGDNTSAICTEAVEKISRYKD